MIDSDTNELEKTKWMISRIDMLHEGMIESLNHDLKKYEIGFDKGISKVKEWRNYLLSPIGVGLTLLLGSTAIFNFDVVVFSTILVILAIIGGIIFVIFTKLIGIIEKIHTEIDFVYANIIEKFWKSQGFMTSNVADISKVNFEEMENYLLFSHSLIGAVMHYISNYLKKMSKQYRYFSDFKKTLEETSVIYDENIEEVKQIWKVFDKTKSVHPDLLRFVEQELESKQKQE